MKSIHVPKCYVALGSRLKGVPEVVTLGVKPNFLDYTPYERELINTSDIILYPTLNYAQFFTTMGKKIFPNLETYLYADEKIKQTTLFYMTGLPHPRTRIYFPLHHKYILDEFSFPFIAKLARNSARGRGVFLIRNRQELETYLKLTKVAYIQEYIPHEKDLRVVLINYKPVIAYWRVKARGEFRTNLSCGGKIAFEDVDQEGVRMACKVARACRFNDVGLDLIKYKGQWFVIEANMKYGRQGLKLKGMELKEIIREKLLSGELLEK